LKQCFWIWETGVGISEKCQGIIILEWKNIFLNDQNTLINYLNAACLVSLIQRLCFKNLCQEKWQKHNLNSRLAFLLHVKNNSFWSQIFASKWKLFTRLGNKKKLEMIKSCLSEIFSVQCNNLNQNTHENTIFPHGSLT